LSGASVPANHRMNKLQYLLLCSWTVDLEVLLFLFLTGLAAGIHSGITYGLREARGCHDRVRPISDSCSGQPLN
jgi:hypothetical protein